MPDARGELDYEQQLREWLAANTARNRKLRKLTQAQLAEKARVDVRTIQDLEGARYNTTMLTLFAVADALQVPTDALRQPSAFGPKKRGRPPKAELGELAVLHPPPTATPKRAGGRKAKSTRRG